jgi:hypothetical protein
MLARFILTSAVLMGLGVLTSACGDDGDDPDGGGESSASGGAGRGGSGNGSGGSSGAAGGTRNGGGSGGSSQNGGRGGSSGASGGSAGSSAGSGNVGPGPSLAGCPMFPIEDAWNTDISGEDVDEEWTERLHALVGNVRLHPDYGRDGNELYGIPINIVPEDQPAADYSFDWWPEQSDEGPYPFPSPDVAKIEGNDPYECDGDCHLLVVQEGTCRLYEGYACHFEDDTWHCGNGVVWDLTKNSYGQRPEGWTSADAAGLAIAPGLLRYDEVVARNVRHALRFTVRCTRANYVAPATHYAVPGGCDPDDPNAPPMGLRVRLSSSFDESGFSDGARAVIAAMKKYGMILADNGSNFYFQGEAHPDWDSDEIEELKTIPASAFEVVTVPELMP